mmetsp:Transcript_12810/g.28177  ORF Transcript_12810/g.28177 Transcript_12810/m.28177 type:complete len:356 (+) Transcript_12810:268-1335(+)
MEQGGQGNDTGPVIEKEGIRNRHIANGGVDTFQIGHELLRISGVRLLFGMMQERLELAAKQNGRGRCGAPFQGGQHFEFRIDQVLSGVVVATHLHERFQAHFARIGFQNLDGHVQSRHGEQLVIIPCDGLWFVLLRLLVIQWTRRRLLVHSLQFQRRVAIQQVKGGGQDGTTIHVKSVHHHASPIKHLQSPVRQIRWNVVLLLLLRIVQRRIGWRRGQGRSGGRQRFVFFFFFHCFVHAHGRFGQWFHLVVLVLLTPSFGALNAGRAGRGSTAALAPAAGGLAFRHHSWVGDQRGAFLQQEVQQILRWGRVFRTLLKLRLLRCVDGTHGIQRGTTAVVASTGGGGGGGARRRALQ